MTFTSPCVIQVNARDDGFSQFKPLGYIGSRQAFQIPVGASTDLASVPRNMDWLIARYGAGVTRCAILHDAACKGSLLVWDDAAEKWVPANLSRRDADGIFRRALLEEGVSPLRADMMWAAVRVAYLRDEGVPLSKAVPDHMTPAEQAALRRLVPKAVVLLAPVPIITVWQSWFRRLEAVHR